jgi:hypothetical protein
MLKLETLQVTQDLRDYKQIDSMIAHVQSGGLFTKDVLEGFAKEQGLKTSPLIQISEFEDGQRFIHDGHHRIVSIWLGEREHINDDEYEIKNWKYQDYLDVAFLKSDGDWLGWVTPYDPRTEVRMADLADFKKCVHDIFYDAGGEAAARNFIANNKMLYVKPRIIKTVPSLAADWRIQNGLHGQLSAAEK